MNNINVETGTDFESNFDPQTGEELPDAGWENFSPDDATDLVDAEGSETGFLGTRWRNLSVKQQSMAWEDLKVWVDWFVLEYKISKIEVPNCWFKHTDIVAELYAAMCAEYKTWEDSEPTLTALTSLHFHFALMRQRLNKRAEQCLRSGEHVDSDVVGGKHRFILDYGTEWEQHLDQITEGVKQND